MVGTSAPRVGSAIHVVEDQLRQVADDQATRPRRFARPRGVDRQQLRTERAEIGCRHCASDVIHACNADPIRQALVAGMLHFATSIGLEIIAEGVETQAERLTLQKLGAALGQGFPFARPRPASG